MKKNLKIYKLIIGLLITFTGFNCTQESSLKMMQNSNTLLNSNKEEESNLRKRKISDATINFQDDEKNSFNSNIINDDAKIEGNCNSVCSCCFGFCVGSWCCCCDNYRFFFPSKGNKNEHKKYLKENYGVLLKVTSGEFKPNNSNETYKLGKVMGNIFGIFSFCLFK